MGDVILMPDSMEKAWIVFECDLRPFMLAMGTRPEVVDAALTAVRPVYLGYAGVPAVRVGQIGVEVSPALVDALNEHMRRVTTGLLTEVLRREVELIELRGPCREAPKPPDAG